MGFLSRLWKGIKKVVGAVAMIAAPFIAGPIAGAIGISGTIGTALVGAGIGGLGAAAAGVNPAIGAALGGLGAFGAARAAGGAAGGGGGGFLSGLFGGGRTAAAAGGAATAAAPAATGLAAPAAAAATGGGFLSGLNLGNIAPLAMAMFGKSPQDLTAEERAAIERNKEIAATERGVFNQQLEGARSLIQAGEANPERAFADSQMATQRSLRDVERTSELSGRPGLQDAARRRAAIEGTRMGTAAVSGEQARAAQTKAAGLSALPAQVPTSGEELNMAIYKDLYKRRADYASDLAGGFGQLYGNIAQ